MTEATGQRTTDDDPSRRLSWSQVRFLVLLGVPALGMTLAVTVISTYLPVILEVISGPVLVGVLIAGEGFFGLFMPALVGGWSDRTAHTVRDRLALALGCATVVLGALIVLGLVAGLGSDTVIAYAAVLALLYAGYYAFLAPYWALYADLVPHEQSGRSRSAEATWRVTGVGLALVGGGLMLDVWHGLPFLVAAGFVLLSVLALVSGLVGRLHLPVEEAPRLEERPPTIALLRDRPVLLICAASALWNFALSSLRAFVVLYFVVGLERSTSFVATVIFPLVALGIAIGAPLSGWAADRWGHVWLVLAGVTVYGVGMSLPGFVQADWVVAMIPLVAFGAATVMALEFSLLMRVLPPRDHGAASGLFGFSRGLGATLGPVVTGIAILQLEPVLPETEGYSAMWLISSAALLLSIPLVLALRGEQRLR